VAFPRNPPRNKTASVSERQVSATIIFATGIFASGKNDGRLAYFLSRERRAN